MTPYCLCHYTNRYPMLPMLLSMHNRTSADSSILPSSMPINAILVIISVHILQQGIITQGAGMAIRA